IPLLVAMLGVFQTGAAYVPIDPTFPPERQEFMLADIQAPVLVTEERYLGTIDAGPTSVICVDRDSERIARHPGGPLGIEVDRGDRHDAAAARRCRVGGQRCAEDLRRRRGAAARAGQ